MENSLVHGILVREIFGNTVQAYLFSLGVFVGVIVAMRIFKAIVIAKLHQWAEKTETDLDDFLIRLLRYISTAAYFWIALYLATRSLSLAESVEQILHFLFVVILTFKVLQILQEVAAYFIGKLLTRAEPDDPTIPVAVKNVNTVVRVALWVFGTLFVLNNLGVNVTSVVAGLGIGGIAIALAAQAVLGDAFSAFSIFVDKPFKVGDFIIVGDMMGTVEHVGFKTTRIRSLGGEQLVFSNTDLTNSRIRNYKRMETRRIAFKFGVVYETTLEQVKAIPGIVEGIIRDHESAKFDRAHFQSYGDFALIFEVVYYVLSPDYTQYMDVQHSINVRLKEAFERRGIEFAYPTQHLYVTQTALQPETAS